MTSIPNTGKNRGEFLISDTRFLNYHHDGTKRTAALITAMALLGTVAPAAFAQNTSVNTDDDWVDQANKIHQEQTAANIAEAGNTGDGSVSAGNNAVALSFQDQHATATNDNDDNDDFNTNQTDICAVVLVGVIC